MAARILALPIQAEPTAITKNTKTCGNIRPPHDPIITCINQYPIKNRKTYEPY
jgi:hypothetical protein